MAKNAAVMDGKAGGASAVTSYSVYNNGVGIVPRRGFDPVTAALLLQAQADPLGAMLLWTQTAPQRLLQFLCDAHPMFGMARSNDLSLAFSPGDTHIVAVNETGGSDDLDEDGTAAIDALWDSLPNETGGLLGLQASLYDQAMTTGLCCLEGVIGARGTGLSDVVPYDPLTIRFMDTPAGRVQQQRQKNGWVELDSSLCLAIPLHGSRQNPYGRPGRSQAFSEGLRDLRDNGQLDEAFEQVGLPRISMGFPFVEAVQFAKDNPELLVGQGTPDPITGAQGDLTPAQWAMAQFEAFADKAINQYDKRIFVRINGGEAAVLSGAAALKALEGTMERRRLRLIQGLDQLPTLMGVDAGGTLAFSSTQWRVQAKKLESIRGFVNGVLVRHATMHLRLLGLNMKARADVEPIQTSEKLADEQARSWQISNEYRLVDEGAQSEEEASINLTGSGPVGPRKETNDAPPAPPLIANAPPVPGEPVKDGAPVKVKP